MRPCGVSVVIGVTGSLGVTSVKGESVFVAADSSLSASSSSVMTFVDCFIRWRSKRLATLLPLTAPVPPESIRRNPYPCLLVELVR